METPRKKAVFDIIPTYLEVDPKKIGKRISFGVGAQTHEAFAHGGKNRGKTECIGKNR